MSGTWFIFTYLLATLIVIEEKKVFKTSLGKFVVLQNCFTRNESNSFKYRTILADTIGIYRSVV